MKKNQVIAKVNGEEICESEVNYLLEVMGPEQAQQFKSEESRTRLKDELVHQRLLYFGAMDKGIDEDEEFQAAFESAKRQFVQQYALRKLLNTAEVDESDVKIYYEANKDKFKPVYFFNADHILVDSEEEAKNIKKELDQGADFADLARQHSTCNSKDIGGSLGDFKSGQMVDEFDKALVEMEEDSISDPVKTEFGYHIIRLNKKEMVQGTDYDSVKDFISQQFLLLKQQEVYANKIRDLEKEFDVERYY